MEMPIISDEPKQKISRFALIWVLVIALCLFFFAASMGLLGWGFYSLFQQADKKSKVPYATATAAAQWPIVFRDDFGKVSDHWYTGDYTEQGRRDVRSISNGVYTWSLENALGYTYWYPSGAGTLNEFAVSVDVQHTVGTVYDGYGLIFCNVAGNYYAFTIQDSGYYSVVLWNVGKWNQIVSPSWSNAIKPGEFNHLMVLAQGNAFKLFINDEFVQEFRDSTLPSGDVGLMLNPQNGPVPANTDPQGVVYSFTNSTAKAVFDNFEVRAPEGSVSNQDSLQLPQIEPEKGRLVFASNRDKNLNIYSISTNGSGLKRLTDDPKDDYSPRWSPDGSKIVFVSERDGNPEIYVMDADGKNITRLTDNPDNDLSPDWSPDGKQIIFSSRRGEDYDIYLMSAQGEKVSLKQLTDKRFSNEMNPSISPDGMQVLFHAKSDIDTRLCVMDIDGQHERPLFFSYDSTNGAWAPDGAHFAYVMEGLGERDILIGDLKRSSGDLTSDQITWNGGTNLDPSWSPSGKQIVFVSYVDGQSDIYIILADGNGIFRVTHNEAIESSPDWHE